MLIFKKFEDLKYFPSLSKQFRKMKSAEKFILINRREKFIIVTHHYRIFYNISRAPYEAEMETNCC
jgi:hypothetical protein